MLADQVGIQLHSVSLGSTRAQFDALRNGDVKLAIVDNSAPFDPGIRTLLPLQPGIVHILYKGEERPQSFALLLRGRRVYAGPLGGVAHRILQLVAGAERVPASDYEVLENPWDPGVDLYFNIGDILSEEGARSLSGFRLFSLDPSGDGGPGSRAAALALRYPYLMPFVLPANLYPQLSQEAVVTLAVPSLLVASASLPDDTAYDVAKTIFENRHEFGSISPLLHNLSERFDFEVLQFPVHPGTQRYLDRNEPSFFERHADLIGLAVSVVIPVASVVLALRSRRFQRRKDRVDTYYGRVLAVREQLGTEPADLLIRRVRDIQSEAFRLLIDEKVDANEGFDILLGLCRDVIDEIKSAGAENQPKVIGSDT